MRIIFFTLTDKLGGAEQLLFKLASHYKKQGEEVSICILGRYSNEVWTKNFPSTYYCNNKIGNLLKYTKKETYNFAYSSHLLFNACLGILRSIGYLKTNKLICRESTLVFGRYRGIKLLKYKIAYFFGYRKIDLLITQSDLMRLSLLKNVPFLKKRTNIITITNLFEFPKEKENKITIAPPFIVSAGRLIPEKGFDILIQSFKLIEQIFPHMKLVILGEGPCRKQLQQLIIQNELCGKVFLKGFVNNVYPYFKKATLCVVSSRREGFPNVLLQMMSQNNKVISTLCAGGIENIDGIVTCFPNNIKCLYDKIKEQLENNGAEENRVKFDLELKKRSVENYVKKIENSLKIRPKIFRTTTVPISLKLLLKDQLRFMSNQGFDVIGISSKGQALQEVREDEGIRTIELEMTRIISPLKDLKALFKFYNLCRREKPLIVHSHTPKAGIISMLGAKLAGIPIRLHTVAGLPLMESTGIKRKILHIAEKLTYLCATAVYPNSKGLYNFILRNNFTSKDKLKIIANGSSNGINTSFFSPDQVSNNQKIELKQKLGIQTNDFVFIFVGRLVHDKGVDELIESFVKLNKAKTKLLLVGGQEKELSPLKRQTLKHISSNKNIIEIGFQKDIRPYFAISDCLVFPSYREGFPNVVMQAGAMGVPSIVSNINGCNEIIIEKENGLFIPVRNIEKLQETMENITKNKELLNKLKKNSRKMIVERYQQKVFWNSLLKEYQEHLTSLQKSRSSYLYSKKIIPVTLISLFQI